MSNPTLKGCPACGTVPECDSKQAYRILSSGEMGEALAIYCPHCDVSLTVCKEDVPDMTMEALLHIWNNQPLVDNMAALVKRLAYRLRKHDQNDELAKRAVAYLQEHGRFGSCLRSDV